MADGDIHIASWTREHAHQALDGDVPELPLEQSRSIRLTESHAPGDGNLGQVLRDDDLLNVRDQFSLEQMGVGIGEAEFSQKWW